MGARDGRVVRTWLVGFALACRVDAEPAAPSESPGPAPGTIELPPLALAGQPAFDHVLEATVAARAGDVVITGVNEHRGSATSYDYRADAFKRMSVWTSHDGGETFGPARDVGGIGETSNSVVRVSADGRFWLSILHFPFDMSQPFGDGYTFTSDDGGDSWSSVGPALNFGDKPWIAPTPDGRSLWIGALNGFWKLGVDGGVSGWAFPEDDGASGQQMTSAIGEDGRVLFWTFDHELLAWSGSGPESVLAELPDVESHPTLSRITASIGPTSDGDVWTVHAVASEASSDVVVRVLAVPDVGAEIPVSEGGSAFYPAAAMDDDGRLHVLWYDTSGPKGVVRYARSRASDLGEGFEPSVVVDDDAVPGDGWTPWVVSEEPIRRLRDYVDLAVDGDRAHLVWTHSPVAPSRIWAKTIRF